MVCPLHGPIWRRDLGYLMDKYKKWASYQPEVRGVLIACASIYGGTETAAGILACRLAERGIPVELYDVSVTHCSYVLSDAFKYSHIVFASATYNNGIFTPMEELLRDRLPRLMHGEEDPQEERAEAAALFAEYAIDFAAQGVRSALLAALAAMDQQMNCEEQQGKEHPV